MSCKKRFENFFYYYDFLKDIFCQYTLYQDPNLVKTELIKGTNNPDFKFTKAYNLDGTPLVFLISSASKNEFNSI